MDICVMSRKEAIRWFGVGHQDAVEPMTAVISITTPEPFCGSLGPVEFDEKSLLAVLPIRFGDVLPEEETAMTDGQGREIVEFVRKVEALGAEHLVVHCDGGVSRSAGVAAAIGVILGIGDDFVFDDPWKCPNMGCYRKVLNAGMIEINEDEVAEKERHNEEIWLAARADEFE